MATTFVSLWSYLFHTHTIRLSADQSFGPTLRYNWKVRSTKVWIKDGAIFENALTSYQKATMALTNKAFALANCSNQHCNRVQKLNVMSVLRK